MTDFKSKPIDEHPTERRSGETELEGVEPRDARDQPDGKAQLGRRHQRRYAFGTRRNDSARRSERSVKTCFSGRRKSAATIASEAVKAAGQKFPAKA